MKKLIYALLLVAAAPACALSIDDLIAQTKVMPTAARLCVRYAMETSTPVAIDDAIMLRYKTPDGKSHGVINPIETSNDKAMSSMFVSILNNCRGWRVR